jgi:hypothetical protein
MRLFPVVAHTANLIIRHSPKYITTAIGGGFLSQIKINFCHRLSLNKIAQAKMQISNIWQKISGKKKTM